MQPLLYLVTTITLSSVTQQTIIMHPTSCPMHCSCEPDPTTYRSSVYCGKGGLDDHRLGRLLDKIRQDTERIQIIGPKFSQRTDGRLPNRFSWSSNFAKFRHLRELHLPRNGITALGKGAFVKSRKLQWLDLSHNELSFVDVSTFFGASGLQHLDLGDNTLSIGGLTSGTFKHLTSLRWLSLANNNLTEAPHNLFGGALQLETLDLSGNQFASTEAIQRILSDAPNIVDLSLDNCGLTQLPQDLFTMVPHLQRLNLANNQLSSIPTLALFATRQLTSLDVSGNGIAHLNEHALYALNVNELNLAHNHLGLCYGDETQNFEPFTHPGINPVAFTGTNITSLDLSYNQFSQFDSSILGDAVNTVRILKLSGNPLRKIDAKQTSGMSLMALHLSDTRINALPARLPKSLHGLVVLNVSHNEFNALPTSTLHGLPYLKVLDVSYCKLSELEYSALKTIQHQMDKALFMGNPLDCHCHIMPLSTYLRTQRLQQHQSIAQIADTRCASPAQFHDIPVTSISTPPDCAIIFGASSGLTQKSELGILGALASATILLLGLLIIVVYVAKSWRRKGVYHTRELSASHTALSSDSSHLSHSSGATNGHHHHHALVHDVDNNDNLDNVGTIVPHPANVKLPLYYPQTKDGADERLF